MDRDESKAGERALGEVKITWNPNTGALQMTTLNMNPMEAIGVVELALHIRKAETTKAPEPARVQLASGLAPHLRQ